LKSAPGLPPERTTLIVRGDRLDSQTRTIRVVRSNFRTARLRQCPDALQIEGANRKALTVVQKMNSIGFN